MPTKITKIANASIMAYDDLPILKADYQPKAGDKLVKGDGHGNWRNILADAQIHGLVTLTREQHNKFNELYQIPAAKLTKENVEEFLDLLQNLTFKNDIDYHLIGDLLADRGQCDFFMLALIDKMKKDNVKVTINLSNHDLEFLRATQNNFAFTHPKATLLQLFYETSITEGGQDSSLQGLGTLLAKKIITVVQIKELMPNYLQSLKLIDYISPGDEDILFLTHAPCPISAYRKVAGLLDVIFDDGTISALKASIDRINAKYTELVTKSDPALSVPSLADQIQKMIWYRWQGGKDEDHLSDDEKAEMVGEYKGYRCRYLYGHVGSSVPKHGEEYAQDNISESIDSDLFQKGIADDLALNLRAEAFSCVINMNSPMAFEHLAVDYLDPNVELFEMPSYEKVLLPLKNRYRESNFTLKKELVAVQYKGAMALEIAKIEAEIGRLIKIANTYEFDDNAPNNIKQIQNFYANRITAFNQTIQGENITHIQLAEALSLLMNSSRLVAKTIDNDLTLIEKQAFLKEYSEKHNGVDVPDEIWQQCQLEKMQKVEKVAEQQKIDELPYVRSIRIIKDILTNDIPKELLASLDPFSWLLDEMKQLGGESMDLGGKMNVNPNLFYIFSGFQLSDADRTLKEALQANFTNFTTNMRNTISALIQEIKEFNAGDDKSIKEQSVINYTTLLTSSAELIGQVVRNHKALKARNVTPEQQDKFLQENATLLRSYSNLHFLQNNLIDQTTEAKQILMFQQAIFCQISQLDMNLRLAHIQKQIPEQDKEKRKALFDLSNDYNQLTENVVTTLADDNISSEIKEKRLNYLLDNANLIYTVADGKTDNMKNKAKAIEDFHTRYHVTEGKTSSSSPFESEKSKNVAKSIFRHVLIAGGVTAGVIGSLFLPHVALGILATAGVGAVATAIHTRKVHGTFFKAKKPTEEQTLKDTQALVHSNPKFKVGGG